MAACCYLASGHDIALRFWRPCRLRGYAAPSPSGVSGSTTCSMESTKRVGGIPLALLERTTRYVKASVKALLLPPQIGHSFRRFFFGG